MKKIVGIILVVGLLFSTCSAFSSEIDLSTMSDAELQDLKYRIEVELKSRSDNAQDIVIRKDEKLTYKKSFIVEKDGKKYLLVEFEYTNVKDYSTSAQPVWMACYQDGIQLDTAYSWDFPDYVFDTPKVRTNITYTFYKAYELRNDSPVELVDDSIYSDTVITIDINKLT